MQQILELDVEKLAGIRGKHDPERSAYRHGQENTKVVMGGEKHTVSRPRVRSKDGAELPLPSLDWFQQEDGLNESILSHLLNGVSTRKYGRCVEQGEPDSACTSKSEVSRRYIAGLGSLMEAFFNRPIKDNYPVIMMDGMTVKDLSVIAAMGITRTGEKRMLDLTAGGSENSQVVKDLLSDLMCRGLATKVPRLFVLDGAKALHKAVFDTFGEYACIQRCQVHKKRNVLSYLPQSEQPNVGLAISKAYLEFEHEPAKDHLLLLIQNLEHRYPKAADSLLDGLEETLMMGGMVTVMSKSFIMKPRCKRLSRRVLTAFAKSVITELELSNNEVMLHLYGGLKVCPDCKEQRLFSHRFCPECGILSRVEDE